MGAPDHLRARTSVFRQQPARILVSLLIVYHDDFVVRGCLIEHALHRLVKKLSEIEAWNDYGDSRWRTKRLALSAGANRWGNRHVRPFAVGNQQLMISLSDFSRPAISDHPTGIEQKGPVAEQLDDRRIVADKHDGVAGTLQVSISIRAPLTEFGIADSEDLVKERTSRTV